MLSGDRERLPGIWRVLCGVLPSNNTPVVLTIVYSVRQNIQSFFQRRDGLVS